MNPAVLFAGMCVFISVLCALTSIATTLPTQRVGSPGLYFAVLSALSAAAATWLSFSVLAR